MSMNAATSPRAASLEASSKKLDRVTAAREQALTNLSRAHKACWREETSTGCVSPETAQAAHDAQAAYNAADAAFEQALAEADELSVPLAPLMEIPFGELGEDD
jgi:hypothetical protein